MQVGEVRVAEDSDFEKLKDLCQTHDQWKQEYNKNTTTVWTKSNELSEFKMIKIRGVFNDVSAATVFDVLNDPVYRSKWDFNMIEAYEICQISPNNDIGYYAMKVPKPLKNRDFVTQRSWLDLGNEYLIFNHSVNHAGLPPKKGFVRGISYITGYVVRPTGSSCKDNGAQIFYVTQSDPKGKLPAWAVNKAAQILAPKVISTLHKACRSYVAWKAKNDPQHKPWLYPEQNTLPRFNTTDIRSIAEATAAEIIDETDAVEESLEEDIDQLKIAADD